MSRIITWTITENQEGSRLTQFLRGAGCSHHVLTHLKNTPNGILLNGAPVFSSQKLTAGDQVQITVTETESSPNITPVPLPLDIVYEDEDLMIINKPADMPIHPSMDNHENTLANAVQYYFASRGIPFVYRCINRLDRDTSGLLIIARHIYSGSVLARMSANREIHREYLAIVQGVLPLEGTVSAPIARAEGSAIKRCVDEARGEEAITHFHRIGTFTAADASAERISLARLRLETGRTHQIRVHMAHIGHPLLGDFLYNPGDNKIRRQALHSHRLEFHHPVTGKPLSFTSRLPADMGSLLPPMF